MKQVSIEEAIRAMNELEVVTTILSETDGYNARRLSMVYRPGKVMSSFAYVVRLKKRQFDETDIITEEAFDNMHAAVKHYNSM